MVKTQSLHSLIYCPALYPVYDEVIIIISGGGGVLLRHVRHHPADSSPQPGSFVGRAEGESASGQHPPVWGDASIASVQPVRHAETHPSPSICPTGKKMKSTK